MATHRLVLLALLLATHAPNWASAQTSTYFPGASIEPEHRGMGDAYRDQPVKERVRRLILDEMVGQDSRRLVRAHGAEAPRPQMFHQTTQRGIFADKLATSLPGDDIDMDIRFDDARCPRGRGSRSRP